MDRDRYEAARTNPELRQDFLDDFDMEEFSPFVEHILYMPKIYMPKTDKFEMAVVQDSSVIFCPPSKVLAFVSDNSFDRLSADEFYNCLVHHEGYHAKDRHDNNVTLLDSLCRKVDNIFNQGRETSRRKYDGEVGAYSNQISHKSFSKCSDKFRANIHRWKNLFKYARDNC